MIPALTVTNVAAYALQVAAIALVGGGTLWAARVHSPRVRLACLRAILVVCLVLPLVAAVPARAMQPSGASLIDIVVGRGLTAAGSVFRVFANPPAGIETADQPTVTAGGSGSVSFVLRFVPVVLVAGIFLRLIWLGVGLVALNRLRTGSPRPQGPGTCKSLQALEDDVLERASQLVGARADFLTARPATRPVTFGLRCPVILLPESFASLDQSEQLAIAVHELLHVRRHDWLYTIGEELLRAVLWFHPAVWWLLGQIDLGREQVVDQEVVALTERRQPYLNALVRLALVPAGPALRPASLLLGRAHLLQRVSLLSREVRMSRWRLAVSILLVAAVVVLGGRLAVRAFPLVGNAGASGAVHDALASSAHPQQPPAQRSPLAVPLVQRVPPAPIAVEPGKDAVVVVAATVDTTGLVTGPVSLYAEGSQAAGNDPATTDKVIDGRMLSPDIAVRMHTALDAVRLWRFEPPARPSLAYVGFNFAGDQVGARVSPIRVGGPVRQPTRIKNVRPVYPEDAQAKGIQGVVILELLIDANGVPVEATALRPIAGLTVPAIDAALQWRFTPAAASGVAAPIMMTVTVNFTLDGGSAGVAGGVSGGIAGGVAGGIAGGVQGGIAGGVPGGVAGGIAPPPPPPGVDAEQWNATLQSGARAGKQTIAVWPQNAIRVGGDIKPPAKTKDVRPVYPAVATSARVQGVVIVEVLIGPDGKVADARILRSIPLLDQAAIDAVRQWEFTPTLLNGTPVYVIMTATVNFTLDERPAELGPQAAQHANILDAGTEAISQRPDGAYVVGPGVTPPLSVRDVKPDYEVTAYKDKVQGSVIVEAVVAPNGKVERVRLLKGLDPRLDQKALEAAMKWEFLPGTRNGVAVPVAVTIEQTFTLR